MEVKREQIIYVDGKPHIKAKVIMLSSNSNAKLGDLRLNNIKGDIYPLGCLTYCAGEATCKMVDSSSDWNIQHLYIISDLEIKDDNWCINTANLEFDNELTLFQVLNGVEIANKCCYIKKIITSTDISLGLPQPSQQFIEKYIEEYNEGNIITEVLVEVELFKPLKGDKVFIGGKEKIVNQDTIFSINFDGYYFYTSSHDAWRCEDYHLKLNSQNQITIRKQKDSWSREEVIELLNKLGYDLSGNGMLLDSNLKLRKEWINLNL